MPAAAFAMQETSERQLSGGLAVDRVGPGFYSYSVFCPTRAGVACCCMCSPPCG
jgi:hypothetical protein